MTQGKATERRQVLLIGGGLAGQTMALALHQAGISVAMVDAAPPATSLAPHFDGRAFAIAYANFRMWRVLGFGDALAETCQPIEQILVTDGRPGHAPSPCFLHFDFQEISQGEPLGYMVENRHLRVALDEAVRAAPGILRLAPAKVEALERLDAFVRARLADGRVIEAELLIGCDGRGSFVRQHAGIRTVGRDYPTTAIVATVRHEKPHGAVAHELFLPQGPFAILPLKGARSNVVWGEPHLAAKALLAMDEADFLAELRVRFGDFLGRVELEGPRFAYPLSVRVAERMIDHRLAIAGDAAHGIHPIAGQGLNLGLKDVAALAECVADGVALGLDAGDATILERYQRWRRFDNIAMAAAMDGFDRLFSNDVAPVRWARDLGIAAVNAVGPARRFFMRAAGADAGLMPKLLKGERLAA